MDNVDLNSDDTTTTDSDNEEPIGDIIDEMVEEEDEEDNVDLNSDEKVMTLKTPPTVIMKFKLKIQIIKW